ncbi:MAG: type II toxin-antitoxin system VapC family toxin [Thermoproteota archaeon]|jgi:predicted nucleic acid-binding protein
MEDKVYLFDASAIVNLIKKGFMKAFIKGFSLNLALYETMNAIWKEHKFGKIDEETALEYIEVLTMAFKLFEILSIGAYEKEVLKLAVKEELTIYDASYLFLAIKNKLILVTDDEKLKNKSLKYIKVLNSKDLLNKT